jgi:TetR/AcrR family transcriptional regulator, cholesterol catabolism regulator
MADPIEIDQSVEGHLPPWQQKRRQKIVRAALELLENGDYDKIQVRDVAQHADVALGTLYRYFSSKEHLYAAVMLEWSKSFRANLRRQPLHGSPPERLKEVVRRVLRAYERRRQFLRLEIVLETSVDEDALAVFGQVGEMNLTGFHEALPPVDPERADLVILAVTSVLQSLLYNYARGRLPIESVYEQTCGVIDLIFSMPPTGAAIADSDHSRRNRKPTTKQNQSAPDRRS